MGMNEMFLFGVDASPDNQYFSDVEDTEDQTDRLAFSDFDHCTSAWT
jgi:hypothetical protein